jgi:hypothetical protein
VTRTEKRRGISSTSLFFPGASPTSF